jgi:hypothetical protein
MSHAALVSDGLFWLFVLMTLLLMMFLYAVVATPPEEATRSSQEPALEPPVPPPPAPASALTARRPQALTSPAGAARQPGAGYTARHAPAAVPAISPPKVTSRPRRGPALALILVIAGLAMAVIGGWLLLSKGHAAPCLHQAAAICSQGFVVLTAIQLTGAAIALAGLILVFTAIFLALR